MANLLDSNWHWSYCPRCGSSSWEVEVRGFTDDGTPTLKRSCRCGRAFFLQIEKGKLNILEEHHA